MHNTYTKLDTKYQKAVIYCRWEKCYQISHIKPSWKIQIKYGKYVIDDNLKICSTKQNAKTEKEAWHQIFASSVI